MLSPLQIHQEIEKEVDRLEDLVAEIRLAGVNAGESESNFKSAFAKHRLTARAEATGKITADHVEDIATVATQDLRLKALVATNQLTVLREALRASEARLDALRTLATSHRLAERG